MNDEGRFRAATAAEVDAALRATEVIQRGRVPSEAWRRSRSRGRCRRRLTASEPGGVEVDELYGSGWRAAGRPRPEWGKHHEARAQEREREVEHSR